MLLVLQCWTSLNYFLCPHCQIHGWKVSEFLDLIIFVFAQSFGLLIGGGVETFKLFCSISQPEVSQQTSTNSLWRLKKNSQLLKENIMLFSQLSFCANPRDLHTHRYEIFNESHAVGEVYWTEGFTNLQAALLFMFLVWRMPVRLCAAEDGLGWRMTDVKGLTCHIAFDLLSLEHNKKGSQMSSDTSDASSNHISTQREGWGDEWFIIKPKAQQPFCAWHVKIVSFWFSWKYQSLVILAVCVG